MRYFKITSILCAAAVLISLAGCGGQPQTSDSSGLLSEEGVSGFDDLLNESVEDRVSEEPQPQSSAGLPASSSKTAQQDASSSAAVKTDMATKYPLTITDDAGRKITVKSKPQNLACISVTMLNTLYQIGGTAQIRTDSTAGGNIPDGAKNITNIGNMVTFDMENLIALKPDLVICQLGLHDTAAAQLLAAGIPTVTLTMGSFDDVLDKVRIIGRIADRQSAAEAFISAMRARVQAIVSKAPKTPPVKAVILYVSAADSAVTVKLDNSIAGSVAKLLGIDHVASGKKPISGTDYLPYSVEDIVAYQPDVILVSSMVSATKDAQNRITAEFESNAIWKNLTAVKENKIHYLPQSYFLYNPGLDYDVAVKYMASLIWPEVFGNVG